jgi:hypothetical protein
MVAEKMSRAMARGSATVVGVVVDDDDDDSVMVFVSTNESHLYNKSSRSMEQN